jgi:hypothetical protein
MIEGRIIVTGANSRYFGSLITLLGSIFVNHAEIDRIVIYDLGLSSLERMILRRVQKAQIREVPAFCPHYLDVENFAWKTAAICDALEHGKAVLWLDAGAEIQCSLDDLFRTIEKDGYLFTVTPLDHPNCRIGHLSHPRALELLDADSDFFRNSLMVNAGVMGFLRGHPVSKLAYKAMEFAANPEIIVGPRYSHRHDQTIYSVLRVKAALPAQYNIFHLHNVDPRYPFLVKARGQDVVPDVVASGWIPSALHIYVLITRDGKPFDFASSIDFAPISVGAGLLLRVGLASLHQIAIATRRLGNLRDRALRLPLARNIHALTRKRAGSGLVGKD